MALTQISTAGVKDDAVTAGKIPANAVGSSELADNAVDEAAIATGAVTVDKIGSSQVTEAKIATGAVTVDKIGNNQVNMNKLSDLDNGRIIARVSGGAGNPEAATAAQIRTLLNVADGATNSTSTTINNNADNRLITGSGTANTLEGEANLTFDGSSFAVTGAMNASRSTDNATTSVITNNGTTGGNVLKLTSGGTGAGTSIFSVFKNNQSSETEVFKIDGAGDVSTSGHLKFAGTTEEITLQTSDGSDNGYLNLSGGGACAQTRGAQLVLNGNERSGYLGTVQLMAGNAGSSSSIIQFFTGGSESMRLQVGGGLSFNGDTAAANALDDYEEGTFTPRLGPNASMSSIHENGVGRYTKVGNMVTCTMHWINKDGTAFPGNQTIRIDNLPFTIKHVGDNTSAHYVAMSQMMYNIQFGQQDKHYFYSSHNTTYLTGLKSRDNTSWQDWSTSDWDQSQIYFNTSVTYMTN